MSGVAVVIAALLAFAPALPRPLWLAAVMAAAFIKARLILLDYLELRQAGPWRSGAITVLGILLSAMALLALARG
jgi:hypothetical protein